MDSEKIPCGVTWMKLRLITMNGEIRVVTDRSDRFMEYVNKVNVPGGYRSIELLPSPIWYPNRR